MKHLIFTSFLIVAFCVFSFAQSEKSDCPTINVIGPNSITYVDEPAFFSVELSDEAKNYKIEHEWKVERAEIAGGQGTSQILVSAKFESENIKVTVKIKGLPENCSNIKSETVAIEPVFVCGLPLDDYGKIPLKQEYARLDNLFANLFYESASKGFIKISTDKNESIEKVKKHIQLMLKHFKFRKFPKERVIFAIEKSDQHKTILQIISEGAKLPVCQDCEILKGEDL